MDKAPITIRIRGQEYRVRSDGGAEELERIASYLEDTMSRVEQRTGTVDSLGVAMLTALNLAREVVELRGAGRSTGGGGDPARLQALIELAESALEGAPAGA